MVFTTYLLYRNLQNNVTTIQTYIVLCYPSYVRNIQAEFTTSICQTSQCATQNDNTFPCTRICKKHIEMVICLRSLFLDFTQRTLEVIYRRFGTTYRKHLRWQAVFTLANGTDKLSLNVAK